MMGLTGTGKSQVRFLLPVHLTPANRSQKVNDTVEHASRLRPGILLPTIFADQVLGHEKHSNKLVLVDIPGFDVTNKTTRRSRL
jgi:hypothetical protein